MGRTRGGRLQAIGSHRRSAPPLDELTDGWLSIPEARRAEVRAVLEPGEVVLAGFEPDLDTRLHYEEGLAVLTDRRLLGALGGEWRSWAWDEVADLRAREHAGIGTFDVLGQSGRLSHWRY